MLPYRLTKEKKATRMKMPNNVFKKCQNCDKTTHS